MNRHQRRAARPASELAPRHLADGLAAHRLGRVEKAAAFYRAAIAADRQCLDAARLLAVTHQQRDRHDEARVILADALARAPDDVPCLAAYGASLRALGHAEEAERAFRRALARNPGLFEAHNNLGNLLAADGRAPDALESYRTALRLKPDAVETWSNLALIASRLGCNAIAGGAWRRVLALRPTHEQALEELARLPLDISPEADPLADLPDAAELWHRIGLEAHGAGRLADAEAAFERVLALDPKRTASWSDLGVVRHESGHVAKALAAFETACTLDPDLADAHANLGFARKNHGDFAGALVCYDRALDRDPAHAGARRNRAIAALTIGHGAWADYRYRDGVDRAAAPMPELPLPVDLRGVRLRVLRDQGLGDEMFFLRFLGALKARGAWLGYEPHPKLAPLLGGHPWIDALLAPDDRPSGVDATVSVGDLPYLLATGDATPPPFAVAVPEADTAHWRARLADFGPPPYCGVTWRAGAAARDKLYKAISPEALGRALAPIPGTPIVFQRGGTSDEYAEFCAALGRMAPDLTAITDDLRDCAALMSALEFYAGVSNTNMHIRACIGKTCRVLVPVSAEFRWRACGSSTPWFPGFRVFRQSLEDGWVGALSALAQDLLPHADEGAAISARPATKRTAS
ncbi:MAG: tetratricopeptide repeat protein [Alphaproteobacteria bacterium]